MSETFRRVLNSQNIIDTSCLVAYTVSEWASKCALRYKLANHRFGWLGKDRFVLTTSLWARFDQVSGDRQLLADHLVGVARRCTGFGASFGFTNLCLQLGLLHDAAGKANPAWQQYLEQQYLGQDADRTTKHAQESAAYFLRCAATQLDPETALMWAAIYCHHAGLQDLQVDRGRNWILGMPLLQKNLREYQAFKALPWLSDLMSTVSQQEELIAPKQDDQYWYTLELLTRMVFSSLVDSDALDAEGFERPDRQAKRIDGFQPLEEIYRRVANYIDQLQLAAADTVVNWNRAYVRRRCRGLASSMPGVYQLHVPTGMGKTLAGVEFCLRHALENRQDRVILVLPFTALIEQVAGQLRQVVGSENVVEHHSRYESDPANWQFNLRDSLATDNWDAPIIVTTTVQFFESVLGARVRRSRKVHHIANSVVFLDEAQAIDARSLFPVLSVLETLVQSFRVSLLISTATVPMWDLAGQRELRTRLNQTVDPTQRRRPYGLSITNLVDQQALAQLPRVSLTWPGLDEPAVSWEQLAKIILSEPLSTLIRVHNRRHVQDLCQAIKKLSPGAPVVALSALLTPRDRTRVIDEVMDSLASNQLVYLVTTSLVEAGIDFDFPRGFAAFSGLDSLVQIAGRVNRNGVLPLSYLYVFNSPEEPADTSRSTARAVTRQLLSEAQDASTALDCFNQEVQREYFRRWYRLMGPQLQTGDEIQDNRLAFNFKTVGDEFRIINEKYTAPLVVVQDQECADAISNIEQGLRLFTAWRKIRRYIVDINQELRDALVSSLNARIVTDDLVVMENPTPQQYDPVYGVQLDQLSSLPANPATLVV